VGYKPTRGTVSFQGITPACLSLDCCSFIARNVEDARKVWEVCEGYDANDRYAKSTPPNLRHVDSVGPQTKEFNFGIPPPEALAVCAPVYRTMFNDAVKTLQSIGGNLVPVDWTPFENAGKLLYDGSFVTERLASLPDGWLESNKDHLHPVIRELFEGVVKRNSTAVQAYRDLQAKALYTRQAETIFSRGPSGIIVLLVPTAPTHWSVSEALGDPIAKNSALGQFTHCGNVLDLTGISVPAGTYALNKITRAPSYVDQTQTAPDADSGNESSDDEQQRLPFGVTFLGGCRTDAEVLEIARMFEGALKAK